MAHASSFKSLAYRSVFIPLLYRIIPLFGQPLNDHARALLLSLVLIGGAFLTIPHNGRLLAGENTPTSVPGITTPITIDGITLQLYQASRQQSYPVGPQNFIPNSPADDLLVVKARTVETDLKNVGKWGVKVVGDSGRTSPAAITATSSFKTDGEITWIFVVSASDTRFVIDLRGNPAIDLVSLFGTDNTSSENIISSPTAMNSPSATLTRSSTPQIDAQPTTINATLSDTDLQKTIAAEMAALEGEATQTMIAGLTVTATHWTVTPTATLSPTPNPRATAAALLTATATLWTPTLLPEPKIVVPFCNDALANGTITGNTYACMVSQGDDWIGDGKTWIWVEKDGTFTVDDATFGGGGVDVKVAGWTLTFAPVRSQTLQVAVYENARRHPFNDPPYPGIDINSPGKGCNQIEGRFEVRELEVDSATKQIQRFSANFEQICDGHGSLAGYVRFNALNPH